MNPAPKPSIGVALIGYGFAGATFHAPLIASVSGLELAVVASSKPDKVRERFPGAGVVATPEEAIADSGVELVVIATPNTSHAPLAAAALAAGKHVVVDKPFTITTAQARALEQQAAASGRLLSVFHNRRWDGDYLRLKQLIAAGELGTIHSFESHIDRFRPVVRDRWRERAGEGAGLWYDLGPHLVDQALQLFGPPATVQATILTQRDDCESDDYAHVTLGYDRPAGNHGKALQVTLQASLLAAGGALRFLVHGSKASWLKYGADAQEPQLLSGMRPGDADWGFDAAEGTLYSGTGGQQSIANLRGCYECYYAAMRDAIRGDGENPVPAGEAVLVMAVLEAAIESGRSGCRIAFAG